MIETHICSFLNFCYPSARLKSHLARNLVPTPTVGVKRNFFKPLCLADLLYIFPGRLHPVALVSKPAPDMEIFAVRLQYHKTNRFVVTE